MNRARRPLSWVLLLALVACTNELTVPTEPLRLLRPEWGVAYVGEPFEGALRPAGGLRPYRFDLADGELPPGLTLAAGRLVGTPTAAGRYAFTALVQDGNLSQSVLRVEVEVRELPTPLIRVDAPATEMRGAVPLVLRVEDARGWRGARVTLRWDPAAFELTTGPTAADARLAVFHEAAEGRLQIDVAALAAPRTGAFALARFGLAPVAGPARLSLEVTSTSRFAGGDHRAERLEGFGPAGAPATPAGGRLGAPGAPLPPEVEEADDDPEGVAAEPTDPDEADEADEVDEVDEVEDEETP
jgi:hypothetical protein